MSPPPARERFVVIWRDVLYDPTISDRAIRVYGCIADHADRSGLAYPSRSRIAHLTGCSVRTVERAVDELVAAGHLMRRRQPLPQPTHYVLPRHHRFKPADSDTPDAIAHGNKPINSDTADAIATGNSANGVVPIATPVTPEVEPMKNTRARSRARARTRHPRGGWETDRAALAALRDGDNPQLESWLENVGAHYAHDDRLFADELEHDQGIVDADVVPALLDRARQSATTEGTVTR